MRILIADDDSISRRILEAVLRKLGHEVIAAAAGDEAWAALQRPDAPRLAILDWMMPGLDGVEVCRRLQETPAADQSYVILLTSRSEKQDIVEGLRAGAKDYITKPFDQEELRARVATGCRVIELQLALEARVGELSQALAQIKTLRGLLRICMHCHRIHTGSDWQRLEAYVEAHSTATFTHGLCPACLEQHYPEEPDEPNEPGVTTALLPRLGAEGR